jgi:hypothetical protein
MISRTDRQRGKLPDIRLVDGRVIYTFARVPRSKNARLVIVCEPDGGLRASIDEEESVPVDPDGAPRARR